MTAPNQNWIANYIWGIADDVLRDVFVRGKYRNVILPMTVLRRAQRSAGAHQAAVLGVRATLDAAGIANQDAALRANVVYEFRDQIPCLDIADVPVWGVKAVQVLEGVGR